MQQKIRSIISFIWTTGQLEIKKQQMVLHNAVGHLKTLQTSRQTGQSEEQMKESSWRGEKEKRAREKKNDSRWRRERKRQTSATGRE